MHGICSPRLLLFCIYFGVFCIYFEITYFFLKNAFPTFSIIFNLVEIWNKAFKIYCITVRAVIKRRATETVMTNQQVIAEQLGKISGGMTYNLSVVKNENVKGCFFSTFAPTYESMLKMLDCKLDMWRNQSYLCSSEC